MDPWDAVAADGALLVSEDNTFRWRPADVPVFTDVLPRAGAGRLNTTVPSFMRDGDVIAALSFPTRSDPADPQSRFGIAAISRTAGVPPRDILRFATRNPARPEIVRGSVIGSATRDEAFYTAPRRHRAARRGPVHARLERRRTLVIPVTVVVEDGEPRVEFSADAP